MFYTIGLVMAATEHVRCYSYRLVGGFLVAHSIAGAHHHGLGETERWLTNSSKKNPESVNWQLIDHHWAPHNPSFCFYDSDAAMDTRQGCVVFMRVKAE